ncbi:hypothetical protein N7468_008587 [Penicillium chermesinum]|uniref:Cyanovirin-N domain-containing protein n=1 Tax=Penicillium chermesinum TaxID=63820 RepID=A0A9W9TK05_9EURO|nr:uncharacterized protein N7468_008587 [Penicillium chermesinum]KAJ5224045.1 hypothetical protein N7468_008587 [Penicillium chermesinum]
MYFNESACDFQLVQDSGGTTLKAICNNEEGAGVSSDILLDEYIGNLDGSFQWGGVNFSKDARNTRLTTEGPNHQVILHSELKNLSGDYVGDHLDLSPYITNTNGTLHFAHEDP